MNNTKTSKFNIGLSFYIVILLSIIAVVWIVLTLFLQSYEESQSDYCINEYIKTADNDTASRIASVQLSNLSDIQDKDVAKTFISSSINKSTPVKYAKETTEDQVTYYLHDGDRFIEKVILVPGKSCGFGFHTWAVRGEEYLLDSIGKTVEIAVPDGYKVTFNGNELNDSYLIDLKEEYKIFDGFYDFNDCQFPYLKRYSLGELFGDNDISVLSPDGKTYLPSEVTEELFINNCTSDEKELIDDITNKFIYAYVNFLSNANRNTDNNYYFMMQYVDSGSKLEERLRDAKKSNGFNSSLGDEITNLSVLNYSKIDSNYYFADVEFNYITTGLNRTKTEMTNHVKLLFRQSSTGELKAVYLVQC